MLPVDQEIQQKYQEIRQLYVSNPLGNVADTTRRTSTEVEMRLQSLRQKWGLSYESLSQELLTPAFVTPFKILIAQKKIEFEMADLDATMINYINALATSQNVQNVEMIIMYMQQAKGAMEIAETVGLNVSKTLSYFQDSLGIPQDLRLTQEEMEALRQQLQQQQQMMLQQQMQQNMQEGATGVDSAMESSGLGGV